jgi:ATP-dependent Clp protease ATP-binding subunit ClpA
MKVLDEKWTQIVTTFSVVRAFVRLREVVSSHKELARKLDQLEQRVAGQDSTIASLVRAIRERAAPPGPKPKRRIGFISDE